jgi:pyruvate dehydrogenase E2 component (dihydrolipoamide acetyltransferase)
VIRDAQTLTTRQLAADLGRLAAAARDSSITAAALTGSTFTVSNFGAFGVDSGAALINPPEVAILGVGRIAQRPWVVEGRLEARPVVQLSLVFDHRAADGAVGGGFLRHLADLIEQPGALHDD